MISDRGYIIHGLAPELSDYHFSTLQGNWVYEKTMGAVNIDFLY